MDLLVTFYWELNHVLSTNFIFKFQENFVQPPPRTLFSKSDGEITAIGYSQTKMGGTFSLFLIVKGKYFFKTRVAKSLTPPCPSKF